MTLQEFLASEDSRGFVEDKVEAMNFNVEFCKINTLEFMEYMKKVDQNYYMIYGYIMAAYSYGHISFEDSRSLIDEVMKLSKVKLG